MNQPFSSWHGGWLEAAQHLPSPNHGPRPPGVEASLIVLHSISLPPGEWGGDGVADLFLNRLDCTAHPYFAGLRELQVSAHFFLRRDGRLCQFVSCDARAWHAGVSSFEGRPNCNDFSIGIELEGLEGGSFCPVQYQRLTRLCQALAARYPIAAVAGHEHIAPGRKHDPGPGFDWLRLQRATGWPRAWFAATGQV